MGNQVNSQTEHITHSNTMPNVPFIKENSQIINNEGLGIDLNFEGDICWNGVALQPMQNQVPSYTSHLNSINQNIPIHQFPITSGPYYDSFNQRLITDYENEQRFTRISRQKRCDTFPKSLFDEPNDLQKHLRTRTSSFNYNDAKLFDLHTFEFSVDDVDSDISS